MKKTPICIFFTLICLFMLALQAFCADNVNFLESIKLSGEKNNYELNLLFKNDFDNSAYIQKQNSGSYYIYIPDTALIKKNIKIKYKTPKNTVHPVVMIKQQPFLKRNTKSAYIKISVWSDEDFNLSLVSEKASPAAIFPILPAAGVILLAGFIGMIFYMRKRRFFRVRNANNCHTVLPRQYVPDEKEMITFSFGNTGNNISIEPETVSDNENDENKDDSSTSSILSALFFKKNKFKNTDDEYLENKERQMMMSQSQSLNTANSVLLKEAMLATNPIENKTGTEITVSQTDSDTQEEIKPAPYQTVPVSAQSDEEKPAPEKTEEISVDIINDPVNNGIVSIAKISPQKGFFLKSNDDDTLALYCYYGKQIKNLKNFDDLSQYNLQTRFYDRTGENDIYIVRLGVYKAMVEFSKTQIKELAVL